MPYAKLDGLNFYGGWTTLLTEATASEDVDEMKAVFVAGIEIREEPLAFRFVDVGALVKTAPVWRANRVYAPEGKYKVSSLNEQMTCVDVAVSGKEETLSDVKKTAGLLVLSIPDYRELARSGERLPKGKPSKFYGIVDVVMMRRGIPA